MNDYGFFSEFFAQIHPPIYYYGGELEESRRKSLFIKWKHMIKTYLFLRPTYGDYISVIIINCLGAEIFCEVICWWQDGRLSMHLLLDEWSLQLSNFSQPYPISTLFIHKQKHILWGRIFRFDTYAPWWLQYHKKNIYFMRLLINNRGLLMLRIWIL